MTDSQDSLCPLWKENQSIFLFFIFFIFLFFIFFIFLFFLFFYSFSSMSISTVIQYDMIYDTVL